MVMQLCWYLLKSSDFALFAPWSFAHSFIHFIHACIHAEGLAVKLRAWNTLGKLSTSKLHPQTCFCSLFWPSITLSHPGCPWTQADFDLIILLPQPSDYLALQDWDTSPGLKFHFPDSDCLFLSYWDEWAGLKYNWHGESYSQESKKHCCEIR